ncbi:MAG: type II toxin-antitoxin system RelE/ParE family toxin [Lachnospiraceae bacterium]|nr:type II toxin-antitoxin system RelE/ParE family toxin [Lachnospiraceae bacterium]
MIAFEIQYTKAADKFLKRHEDIREHYEQDLVRLLTDDHPEDVDVKRIRGKHSVYYRIRIGTYRVLYTLSARKIIVVSTVLAGNRGDIYKKMGGLK